MNNYNKLKELNDVRHLYLYAKGYYKKSDNIINDLKVICGRITGKYPEHVDVYNIIYWLTKEAYKHIINYDQFFNFIITFFLKINIMIKI